MNIESNTAPQALALLLTEGVDDTVENPCSMDVGGNATASKEVLPGP